MTKAEQVRLARWRMKVLRHVTETPQNVSQTCRYFGISRKTFYCGLDFGRIPSDDNATA